MKNSRLSLYEEVELLKTKAQNARNNPGVMNQLTSDLSFLTDRLSSTEKLTYLSCCEDGKVTKMWDSTDPSNTDMEGKMGMPDISSDWKSSYVMAMRELNRVRLKFLVTDTEMAVLMRYKEIADSPDHDAERVHMGSALDDLRAVKLHLIR